MDQLRPVENVQSIPLFNSNLGTSIELDNNIKQANGATKTVDMNNLEEPSSKFKINLFEHDISTDFLKHKSEDAKPQADNRNTTYINPGPVNSSGFTVGGQLIKSKDDLRSGVKAALMVIDYAMSLMAMKIAGDSHQTRYTADSQQKKLLEDVIVEYLYGKQTQMPLWLTLTFAVAGSYGIIMVGAFKQRKELNARSKTLPKTPTGPVSPTSWPKEDAKKHVEIKPNYVDIKPVVTPPKFTPVMDQAYNVSKDGTATPVKESYSNNIQSYSDIMEQPTKVSYPYSPDPDIIADNPAHVRILVSKGVYPMYRRDGKGRTVKIKYAVDGSPLIPGKQSKVFKRK